jgi:oligoendopeptidase F
MTETKTIIEALRILARDIQSQDGVANAAIAEAADRLEKQQKRIRNQRREIEALAEMQAVLKKRSQALRFIQTWASCDSLSQDTREQAMEDIVNKCREALS